MITTNIESVRYADGRRVEIIVNTFTPSDDTAQLARYYGILAQKLTRKEQLGTNEPHSDAEIGQLDAEIESCRLLIARQQGYIDGYGGE